MASFRYKAVDEAGAAVAGTLVADSAEDARARLREMRLFPERVERAERHGGPPGGPPAGPRARVVQHVTVFTRQLAILLASGVPAVSALGVLAPRPSIAAFRKRSRRLPRRSMRADPSPSPWPAIRNSSTAPTWEWCLGGEERLDGHGLHAAGGVS